MKILIASDIHGSAKYCRELLAAMDREQPDRVLLLGDLLYHGPRNDLPEEYAPKEVIAMLNGIREKLFCVRGNCDTEVDQMVLTFPILADYCLLEEKGVLIFATHGHHYNLSAPPLLKKARSDPKSKSRTVAVRLLLLHMALIQDAQKQTGAFCA